MRQGQKTRWHRSWSQLSRLRCFFLLQCASTRPDAVSRLVPIDRTSDDLHDRLPKTPHAATPHQDPTTHKRRKKRKKKKTRSDYNAPDWLRPWLLLPVFFFFFVVFLFLNSRIPFTWGNAWEWCNLQCSSSQVPGTIRNKAPTISYLLLPLGQLQRRPPPTSFTYQANHTLCPCTYITTCIPYTVQHAKIRPSYTTLGFFTSPRTRSSAFHHSPVG